MSPSAPCSPSTALTRPPRGSHPIFGCTLLEDRGYTLVVSVLWCLLPCNLLSNPLGTAGRFSSFHKSAFVGFDRKSLFRVPSVRKRAESPHRRARCLGESVLPPVDNPLCLSPLTADSDNALEAALRMGTGAASPRRAAFLSRASKANTASRLPADWELGAELSILEKL